MNRGSNARHPAAEFAALQGAPSIHTLENELTKLPPRMAEMGNQVQYQIFYYNGLSCQQKKNNNVESRVSTKYYKGGKIQLKIRCFTGNAPEMRIVPGLGPVPLNAVVGAGAGFLDLHNVGREGLKGFVNDQAKEILNSAKIMRKIIIIGHSLGGRIVNMIAEKVNNFGYNFADKFIILTLGSVENANIDKLRNIKNFHQIMNVEDLVLNGLFHETKRAWQVTPLLKDVRPGELVVKNLPISWKKWPSLTKVFPDPKRRITWIKTKSPTYKDVHSDYDKKEGLLKEAVQYFENRIRINNSKQTNRNAENKRKVAQHLLRRALRRRQGGVQRPRAMTNENIKKVRQAARVPRNARLNARLRNNNAPAPAARRRAGMAEAIDPGAVMRVVMQVGEQNARTTAANLRQVLHRRSIAQTSIGDITRMMAWASGALNRAPAARLRNIQGRIGDAQMAIIIENITRQVGRLISETLSGTLDWGIAIALMEPADIARLQIRKNNGTNFSKNNLYGVAYTNQSKVMKNVYGFEQKKVGELTRTDKLKITSYVRTKIREDEDLSWVVPRLFNFVTRFFLNRLIEDIATPKVMAKVANLARRSAATLAPPAAWVIGASGYPVTGVAVRAGSALHRAWVTGRMEPVKSAIGKARNVVKQAGRGARTLGGSAVSLGKRAASALPGAGIINRARRNAAARQANQRERRARAPAQEVPAKLRRRLVREERQSNRAAVQKPSRVKIIKEKLVNATL